MIRKGIIGSLLRLIGGKPEENDRTIDQEIINFDGLISRLDTIVNNIEEQEIERLDENVNELLVFLEYFSLRREYSESEQNIITGIHIYFEDLKEDKIRKRFIPNKNIPQIQNFIYLASQVEEKRRKKTPDL